MRTFKEVFDWWVKHPGLVAGELTRIEAALGASVDQDTLSHLREVGRGSVALIDAIAAESQQVRDVLQAALRLQHQAPDYDLAAHLSAAKAAALDLMAKAEAMLPKDGQGRIVLTRSAAAGAPFEVARFDDAAKLEEVRTAMQGAAQAYRPVKARQAPLSGGAESPARS